LELFDRTERTVECVALFGFLGADRRDGFQTAGNTRHRLSNGRFEKNVSEQPEVLDLGVDEDVAPADAQTSNRRRTDPRIAILRKVVSGRLGDREYRARSVRLIGRPCRHVDVVRTRELYGAAADAHAELDGRGSIDERRRHSAYLQRDDTGRASSALDHGQR